MCLKKAAVWTIWAAGSHGAQARAATAIGRRGDKSKHRDQQGKTKAQEKSQQWRKRGETERENRSGEKVTDRQCRRVPMGRVGGRRRQRTREGRQRGSGRQFPSPSLLNFGVALVTASKGQG